MALLTSYDNVVKEEVRELESEVDNMVDGCNQFLIQLSSVESSGKESGTCLQRLKR